MTTLAKQAADYLSHKRATFVGSPREFSELITVSGYARKISNTSVTGGSLVEEKPISITHQFDDHSVLKICFNRFLCNWGCGGDMKSDWLYMKDHPGLKKDVFKFVEPEWVRPRSKAESEKPFTREQRYAVYKLSKLTSDQKQRLHDLDTELSRYESVGPCVVVEHDWPEYESTWQAIEDRVTGKTGSISANEVKPESSTSLKETLDKVTGYEQANERANRDQIEPFKWHRLPKKGEAVICPDGYAYVDKFNIIMEADCIFTDLQVQVIGGAKSCWPTMMVKPVSLATKEDIERADRLLKLDAVGRGIRAEEKITFWQFVTRNELFAGGIAASLFVLLFVL